MVDALLCLLSGIDHGENDTIGTAFQNRLCIAHLMVRGTDNGAGATGIGGDDGIFQHGEGNSSVLRIDPHIVIAQQTSHFIKFQFGGGAVGTEAQLTFFYLGMKLFYKIHKEAPFYFTVAW